MAQQLIEQWRLAVLEVSLDLSHRTPGVSTTLSAYNGDQPQQLWTITASLDEFGVAAEPPYRLTVPYRIVEATARSVLGELQGEAALWIRLVPPYGLLGAVPWERELIAATEVPVFRVPDRLPIPVVRGTVWYGAIAVDGGDGEDWAAPYIESLVAQWRAQIPARVEVDVFADGRTTRQLGRTLSADTTVRIHEPKKAAEISRVRIPRRSAAPSSTRPLPASAVGGSIWADWIAQGLAGRAVRAVHIALDGFWDGAAPVLLISHDPCRPTKRMHADMVGVTDLMQFVQAIGAATVSFGAPPHGLDEVAVRQFADTVGQQRTGATLFTSISGDPLGEHLAAAEAFLIDPASGRPVPRHPSLFAYAQPERLAAILRQGWPGGVRRMPTSTPSGLEALHQQADSTLADRYASSDAVPAWVASTDQYLGTQWAAIAEKETAAIPADAARREYDLGAKDALNVIRDIVERYARPPS